MNINDYKKLVKKKDKSIKNNNYITNLITRSLITVILVFSTLIIINLSPNSKAFIKKHFFTTNYNFHHFNKLYNKYFLNINKNPKKVLSVFNEKENCVKYKDGCKMKKTNIANLESGIVVFLGVKENIGNTIIIQGSNGIDYSYSFLDKINVKLYDYINKGENIGTTKDKVYYNFSKDGKVLDYKEYIK